MLQILVLTALSPRNDGRMGVASDHTAAMGASSSREQREEAMCIFIFECRKKLLIGRLNNFMTRMIVVSETNDRYD